MYSNSFAVRLALAAPLLLAVSVALAQDPNVCDEPGETPNVIVGNLHQLARLGTYNDITAYSVGTLACNIGSCWVNWIGNTNEHPVIAQNMYRYKDGRFEQVGQSWLKHGFFALSEQFCSLGCVPTAGDHLGVNCSDAYDASLNALQARMGPRSDVNPTTGFFNHPYSTQGVVNDPVDPDPAADVIYKRLQVHNDDLDPVLNPGARYFVEGQYVAADDAAAGNGGNNSSYREIEVTDSGNGVFDIAFVGEAFVGDPADAAWPTIQSGVHRVEHQVPGDGQYNLLARATDLGGGIWRYEYALHNVDSHRSGMSFEVAVRPAAIVSNVGFHDVDYHSNELYDGTDWASTVDGAEHPEAVFWSTDSFDTDPEANALRWGTLYNFRFDADAAPVVGNTTLGLFRPGNPTSVQIESLVPLGCNGNGICDGIEDCNNCPADCAEQTGQTPFCGDGSCQPSVGEDCQSCASDCNGSQLGSPQDDFCCGDGDGDNPVDCGDPRCSEPGFTCGIIVNPFCCGDMICDPGEDSCICATDCGPPPVVESTCDDGLDDDCDGDVDCQDIECCADLACEDGIDGDGDGVANCDCDDGDIGVWAAPSECPELWIAANGPGGTELVWSAPLLPGADTWTYELLRSTMASDFDGAAVCLTLADPALPAGLDDEDPSDIFYYLVRAANDCPAELRLGSLGEWAEGARTGLTCP